MKTISSNIFDLVGEGEEWLMSKDGSRIVAKFYDGKIQDAVAGGDTTCALSDLENTLILTS